MKKIDPKIVAKMKPEQRARYESDLKRAKRNRGILTAVIAFIAIAAVCCALSVTVLFNITSINVKQAGKYYSAEQIISASGLDVGNNIIRTDFENSADRIKKNLPYVYDVKITKSFSGAVTISVTDGTKSMIARNDIGYAIMDKSGKILETYRTEQETDDLLVIKTYNPIEGEIGEVFRFLTEDETKLYNQIQTAISKSGIKDITEIDFYNPNCIYLTYQNRFRLKLGTNADMDKKLVEAIKIIATEDESSTETIGEINLTILKKVYVTPLETLEETTTEKSDESTSSNENDEVENTYNEKTEENGESENNSEKSEENEE